MVEIVLGSYQVLLNRSGDVTLKMDVIDVRFLDYMEYNNPGNIDVFFFLGNVFFRPSTRIVSPTTYRQSQT